MSTSRPVPKTCLISSSVLDFFNSYDLSSHASRLSKNSMELSIAEPADFSKQNSIKMNCISSHILAKQNLSTPPKPGVRYIEVPIIEEVIKHVPKKEIVEVERIVPRIEYEYIDRIVEVPEIHIINKHVEVPQVHEVLRHVNKREIVEVPKEVIVHVPKIETVMVEKVVEVPGQIIEVPKPYIVENKILVPRYVDNEVPTVVSQVVQPIIRKSKEIINVDVYELEPVIVPVDVVVAKPIPLTLISKGAVNEQHRMVNVPSVQYNTILKDLNGHLVATPEALPFIRDSSGAVVFLENSIGAQYTTPIQHARMMNTEMKEMPIMALPTQPTRDNRSIYDVPSPTNRSRASPKKPRS